MTLQEAFNRVWERAKTPVRAANAEGKCFYRLNRDPNDTSPANVCFVGALIPPEKYQPEWDTLEETSTLDDILLACDLTDKGMEDFATDCQSIHDAGDGNIPHWQRHLLDRAQFYGLTIPE